MKACLLTRALLAAGLLSLTACNYDFPLTEKPTRKTDPRLTGSWVAYSAEDQKVMAMEVRRLDEFSYVVALEGDLYRVTHSDCAGLAFVSVQDLQPGDYYGKFAYYAWTLSPDGRQLTVRGVTTKVVSGNLGDAAAAQKLIQANLANQALLGEPIVFTPKKR